MCENLFSGTIATQARRFAQANNSRPKTSLPRRHKLNESSTLCKKKEDNQSCLQILRRVLDSNQWIPYDIGSLANCWFQPLTQLSVAVILKSSAKILHFRNNAKFYRKKLLLSPKCEVSACDETINGTHSCSKNFRRCSPYATHLDKELHTSVV